MRRFFLTVVMIALVAGAVVYGAKFRSVWKAPDVDRLNFAGKKVAAVVITEDQDLQVSAEEELARQLTALGVQGVPSYRLVPREVIRDKAKVKEWFERSGTAGLVVIRVVSADKEVSYTPDLWVTSMYANPWDYYAYGWGTAIGGVNRREELVVTIETLVYSVPLSKLVWAGVSEKTNPKDAQKVVKDLVGAVVSEMRKGGLVPKGTP
ncbi:MAG: hypothetical protein MUE61_14975 [Vicinamibacterales bacterium]|jgi:hypothetical protein|nr:hypothetical protein [Vicinamibacterales bacterium]